MDRGAGHGAGYVEHDDKLARRCRRQRLSRIRVGWQQHSQEIGVLANGFCEQSRARGIADIRAPNQHEIAVGGHHALGQGYDRGAIIAAGDIDYMIEALEVRDGEARHQG